MDRNTQPHERQHDRPIPDFPKHCRACNGKMVEVSEEVHAYDIFTGAVRTKKYIYACENDDRHIKLVVLDTPSRGFRAVIREDRYDENRAKK